MEAKKVEGSARRDKNGRARPGSPGSPGRPSGDRRSSGGRLILSSPASSPKSLVVRRFAGSRSLAQRRYHLNRCFKKITIRWDDANINTSLLLSIMTISLLLLRLQSKAKLNWYSKVPHNAISCIRKDKTTLSCTFCFRHWELHFGFLAKLEV